jgi:hypothetical protein
MKLKIKQIFSVRAGRNAFVSDHLDPRTGIDGDFDVDFGRILQETISGISIFTVVPLPTSDSMAIFP